MNIYYVYAYINQKTGKPYYIGKGKGDRINKPHQNLNIPPDPKNRIIIENNLSEQEAWSLEVELIEKYGRKDLETGILLNRTSGGIGGDTSMYRDYSPLSTETKEKIRSTKSENPNLAWNKGLKTGPLREYGPLSKEQKEKLRQANLGKKRKKESIEKTARALRGRKRPEASKWLIGRPVSENTRRKISESNKGKKLTEETKQKIKKARAKQVFSDETKQKLKGKVVVIDKKGNILKIDKEVYYSQPDIGDSRPYVFHNCIEGKRRKQLLMIST